MKGLGADDSGVFAASARAFGTEVWDVAGALTAGAAAGGDRHAGRGQPIFTRALHSRLQPQVRGGGRTESECLSAFEPVGSGLGVHGANRAYRRQGQHRHDWRASVADREVSLRSTLAGCTITIHEHLDGRVSLRYGPHVVGRFDSQGKPLNKTANTKRGGKGGNLA